MIPRGPRRSRSMPSEGANVARCRITADRTAPGASPSTSGNPANHRPGPPSPFPAAAVHRGIKTLPSAGPRGHRGKRLPGWPGLSTLMAGATKRQTGCCRPDDNRPRNLPLTSMVASGGTLGWTPPNVHSAKATALLRSSPLMATAGIAPSRRILSIARQVGFHDRPGA